MPVIAIVFFKKNKKQKTPIILKNVFQATLFRGAHSGRFCVRTNKIKKRPFSLWKIREGKRLLYAPFSQSIYFRKIILISTLSSLWSGYKSLGKLDRPFVSSTGRSFSRTWEPPLWKADIKMAPVSQFLWEDRRLTSLALCSNFQGYPRHKGTGSILPVAKASKLTQKATWGLAEARTLYVWRKVLPRPVLGDSSWFILEPWVVSVWLCEETGLLSVFPISPYCPWCVSRPDWMFLQ